MVFLIKTMKGFDWRRRFSVFFILIAFWEIFEGNFKAISAEATIDIIYDLVVGMAGGFFIYYYNFKVLKR